MNRIIRQIPNSLTLLNLLLGTLAIIAVMLDRIPEALILMGICLLADIMDGAIARRLGVSNELGIQLDSLADMVSFGVLPGMMIFYMGSRYGGSSLEMTAGLMGALNATSAGLRLGRFNVDEKPREYFWGLATPSGAILIAGWLWAQHIDKDYGFGVAAMPFLIVIIPLFLVFAYQIAVKLPGLKSPKTGIMIAASIVFLIVIGFIVIGPLSIPAGIILYYLIGLINYAGKWF